MADKLFGGIESVIDAAEIGHLVIAIAHNVSDAMADQTPAGPMDARYPAKQRTLIAVNQNTLGI